MANEQDPTNVTSLTEFRADRAESDADAADIRHLSISQLREKNARDAAATIRAALNSGLNPLIEDFAPDPLQNLEQLQEVADNSQQSLMGVLALRRLAHSTGMISGDRSVANIAITALQTLKETVDQALEGIPQSDADSSTTQ